MLPAEKKSDFGSSVVSFTDIFKPNLNLDLLSGKNAVKTPKKLLRKIKSADLSADSGQYFENAVLNISEINGVKKENVLFANSVDSLIDLVLSSLKIRSATVITPDYTGYKNICRANRCDTDFYTLKKNHNFKLNCEDFIECLSAKSDALILSNPNIVTGRVVSKSDIRLILDYCQSKGIYVILDERYSDFVLENQSMSKEIESYHNLLIVKSVSSYFGLPGICASYLIANSEVIEVMQDNCVHFTVDTPGYILLNEAGKYEKFELATKKWIFNQKKKLVSSLSGVSGIYVIPSDCHFVLMSLGEVSAANVKNRLLKSNISIYDASNVSGLDGSYIRVALTDDKSSRIFVEELLRCLI